MNFYQSPFLERFYELDRQANVCIKIFQPYLDETDYRTEFTITGLDKSIQSHAYGIDGFQSIYLAMFKIGVLLYNCEAYKTGRLKFLDSDDLQLPNTVSMSKDEQTLN